MVDDCRGQRGAHFAGDCGLNDPPVDLEVGNGTTWSACEASAIGIDSEGHVADVLVSDADSRIQRQGALAGFVLNRAKFSVGSGYYYYYYGYKYSEKAYHK